MRLRSLTLALLLASVSATAFAGALSIPPANPADPLLHVPASWRVGPEGTPLDASSLKTLGTGDVLSALLEIKDNPVKKGVAIGIVDGAPAKVLATCSDFEHFPDFMPYIAKINVDERGDHTATVSYWLEFPLGIGNRNYQLKLNDGTKTLDGEKVYFSEWTYTGKGNIKDTSGSWEIAPWGDGTKSFVRYTVVTDPGGSLPTWAKNKAASVALPKVVKRVQDRVKSKDAAKPVDF